MSSRFYRFVPTISSLVIFTAMALLYISGNKELYHDVLIHYGINPFAVPFLDIDAPLSAWDCTRRGFDVMISNPCDLLLRPFNYSPVWVSLANVVPLSGGDRVVIGIIADLLFLGSFSLLPPPRRVGELLITLGATLSTMVVLAVERANLDVIFFVMAIATVLLGERRLCVRIIGYALVMIATLIKYYPITVMVLAFREKIRALLTISFCMAIIIVIFWLQYHTQIGAGLHNVPHDHYQGAFFSSQNLPFRLAGVIETRIMPGAASSAVGSLAAGALYCALVGLVIVLCWRLLSSGALPSALAALPQREWLLLVTGSAVIGGCFFAGQNIGYRGIYFLLVVPGLLSIRRNAADRYVRNLATVACLVIVVLMWSEALRTGLARAQILGEWGHWDEFLLWLVRELAWWWIVSILITVIADFLRRSPLVLRYWPLCGGGNSEMGNLRAAMRGP